MRCLPHYTTTTTRCPLANSPLLLWSSLPPSRHLSSTPPPPPIYTHPLTQAMKLKRSAFRSANHQASSGARPNGFEPEPSESNGHGGR
jgi:hypothetical protein